MDSALIFQLLKKFLADSNKFKYTLSTDRAKRITRKKNVEKIALLHGLVPGAGVEPARITPTVFETVASTDSAIRALVRAKVCIFF